MPPVFANFDSRSCACLTTSRGAPVPLEGVDVRAEVFGAHARVVLRQRYRNTEASAVEAIYTFPAPSEAVLVGFAMECAGRRLEAEVKERDEAFAAYDDALSAGHGAALLDEERRNVFTASVGNLLPDEETVVEVAYLQALRADEGALRLVVPTVVAPRYVPPGASVDRTGHGAADPTARVPDADRISPKIGDVEYGFTLDAIFDLGRDVDVESPSHAVKVTREDGGRTRVRLRRAEAPLDRDLVLVASGAPGVSAGVVVDRDGDAAGTLALTVVPDLFDAKAGRAPGREVFFLVDVSGSMQGASIDQARSALRLCLRQLSESDRFQMIAFSDRQTIFGGKSFALTQRSLEQADAWIGSLEANGGTEILEPLLYALDDLAGRPGRDRVVVLLTDGQVANEAEIVNRAALRAKGTRIYTFGIGTAVSDLLVTDLARRTSGAAEFIHPGERIEEKVTAQFARAIAARVTRVKLAFDGVEVDEIAPAVLPDLVDGEPWAVYGRFTEGGVGKAQIRGERAGEPFYLEVSVDLTPGARHAGLAALWARARIRDLEEANVEGRRAEANKKRIVALSVEHQIMSKHASFVVVEKRRGDRLAHGQPEARPVPVSAPAGWQSPHAARPSAKGFAAVRRSAAAGAPVMLGASGGRRPSMPAPQAGAYGAAPAPRGGGQGYGAPPAAPAPAAFKASNEVGAAFGGAPAKRGIVDRVRSFLGRADDAPAAPAFAELRDVEMSELAATASAMAAPSPADPQLQAPPRRGAAEPTELFAAQLASGLWPGAEDTDASRLLATAGALASAFAAGIDASHAMFGGQIKKAVDAILAVAPALIGDATAEQAVTAALLAAHLVSTGKRKREELLALVSGGRLAAAAALFAAPDAAQRRLVELTS